MWYELLCGEWPFKGQPPEAIIWQVGKGIKQPLANLQASRDVKVCSLIFNTLQIIVVNRLLFEFFRFIIEHLASLKMPFRIWCIILKYTCLSIIYRASLRN